MNNPSPLPPDPPEPFPFGTVFRAVCIVFFVVDLALCVAGFDSDKLVSLGGLSIALFAISLWFSELRCGKILTAQHEGVSRWEDPAKFRRVMIVQAIFRLVFLAVMAIATVKAFFDVKPEPHAESPLERSSPRGHGSALPNGNSILKTAPRGRDATAARRGATSRPPNPQPRHEPIRRSS